MASTELVASYFGAPGKRLFGCFNLSRSKRSRPGAIIICQPNGHEYINSHRALRQLAHRLSGMGFPVLRFDFLGCGDSEGDASECRVAEWIENLSDAISEISRYAGSGTSNLCLIGLRLGASVAVLAASARKDIRRLVLWDPIIKGGEYLNELDTFQRQQLRFRPKPGKAHSSRWPKDILGFPITQELYREIAQVNLLASRERPADTVLLVDTANHAAQDDFKNVLEAMGVSVELRHIDAPLIWIPTVDGGLQVPADVLQSVAAWVDQAYR